MYNTDTEIKFKNNELTVGKLIETLSKMDSSTKVLITGDNCCYIMKDKNKNIINIDVVDADSIND